MQQRREHARWGRRYSHEADLLAHLRAHGATDRAALADALHLSRATVSTLTRDLLATGAVTATAAPARSRTGRRPELLTLNPEAGLIVGIDLGHTHVTIAAADAAHTVVGTRTLHCAADTPWPERTRIAVEIVNALTRTRPAASLLGVGVGIAGSIAHRDAIVDDTHATIATALDVPVIVDNNTRLAGLAEHIWGVARGMRDVVYLRLAAGIGGTIVLDGELRLGPRSLAGELGHVRVTAEPLPCRCGGQGCLETIAGREALLAAAGASSLSALADRLAAGDQRAQAAVLRAADAIGQVLAGTCTALDLRDVVIAGELTMLGSHLLTPVRAALDRNALTTESADAAPRLHVAQLGQFAGALGGIGSVLRDPSIAFPVTATA